LLSKEAAGDMQRDLNIQRCKTGSTPIQPPGT